MPAYLLIPKDVLAGKKKAPAVLCLHGTNNVIGGSTAAARNIISATQQGEGIGFIQNSINNVVQGNYIGTDVTGNVAMGNQSGISDLFGGQVGPGNNKFGGAAPGEGNLISGNKSLAINLNGSTGNDIIQGGSGTDFGIGP